MLLGLFFLLISNIFLLYSAPGSVSLAFDDSICHGFFTYLYVKYPLLSLGLAQIVIVFEAYWLNRIVNSLRFFGEITYLPFWLFIFFNAFFYAGHFLGENQVMNGFMILTLRQVLRYPNQDKISRYVPLNLGAFLAIAFIFSNKAWILFVFILFSFFSLGRFGRKDILQVLITLSCYALPMAFLTKWLNMDRSLLPQLSDIQLSTVLLLPSAPSFILVYLAYLLLFLGIVFPFPKEVYLYKVLSYFQSFLKISLILVVLIILLFIPTFTNNFVLLSIPLSILLSRILLITQSKILFFLGFLTCIIGFLYPLAKQYFF